jgi:gliding motility-associated-like protein
MKHVLALILIFLGLHSIGQVVTVTPTDVSVCQGGKQTFRATVPDTLGPFTFQWLKDGVMLSGSTGQTLTLTGIKPSDSGFYRCIAKTDSTADSSNLARLRVNAALKIDTLYRFNSLFCPDVCSAFYIDHVSGGDGPYYYQLFKGNNTAPSQEGLLDTIIFNLCHSSYLLTVVDSAPTLRCISKEFFVEAYPIPKVKITKSPKDTIYLTNPTLTVNFQDSLKQYLKSWRWVFYENVVKDSVVTSKDSTVVENLNPATHDYTKTGTFDIDLFFQDENNCDSVATTTILVKIVDLMIPSVFTPNHDGSNDLFEMKDNQGSGRTVDLQKVYLSNSLKVYDRWGRKVYDKDNYASGDWDGENLSDGAYFYIFKGHGKYSDDVFKGSVTILR